MVSSSSVTIAQKTDVNVRYYTNQALSSEEHVYHRGGGIARELTMLIQINTT